MIFSQKSTLRQPYHITQTVQEFKSTTIWREDLKAFHVPRSNDALIGSKSLWLNSTN